VADRKVGGLLACGGNVTVVTSEIGKQLAERITGIAESGGAASGGALRVLQRPYRTGDATGYQLVITATGVDEVDQAVASDCEAAGIWVNSADDTEHSSFVLPSVHRDGPLTLAVSSAGTSPALAVWLRRRLGAQLDPSLATAADLVARSRRTLKEQGRSTEAIDWQGFFNGPFLALVETGQLESARALLDTLIDEGPTEDPAQG
jgi:precorrin-2 dehydrogenase/sirohydrochlorin ferrochelatase